MDESIDKPADTPLIHLSRAAVAYALETDELLWYYSDRTGWLCIRLVDLPPKNPIST